MQPFEKYYEGCDPYCSIGRDKAKVAFHIIHSCPRGDLAELGVYRGGFTMMLGKIAADLCVTAYGFDTFEGIPFQGPDDKHAVGDFVHPDGDFDEVGARVNANVHLIKCIFTKDIAGHNRLYSFVHLDADQYQSTADGLEFFYPKLMAGGAILIDDHDWHACPGVNKALTESGIPYKKPSRYQALIRKD